MCRNFFRGWVRVLRVSSPPPFETRCFPAPPSFFDSFPPAYVPYRDAAVFVAKAAVYAIEFVLEHSNRHSHRQFHRQSHNRTQCQCAVDPGGHSKRDSYGIAHRFDSDRAPEAALWHSLGDDFANTIADSNTYTHANEVGDEHVHAVHDSYKTLYVFCFRVPLSFYFFATFCFWHRLCNALTFILTRFEILRLFLPRLPVRCLFVLVAIALNTPQPRKSACKRTVFGKSPAAARSPDKKRFPMGSARGAQQSRRRVLCIQHFTSSAV